MSPQVWPAAGTTSWCTWPVVGAMVVTEDVETVKVAQDVAAGDGVLAESLAATVASLPSRPVAALGFSVPSPPQQGQGGVS